VSSKPGARPVYSTESGRLCPKCGWPAEACRCSTRFDEALPARIVAKLRIETGGRGGKTVTVVDGLPRNATFLAELARELKRACGSGGAVRESAVEIQGDHRDRLRALLGGKGWTVKG
jgi:translation initiation factor 1